MRAMTTLRQAIEKSVNQATRGIVDGIIEALRSVSLDDIVEFRSGRGGQKKSTASTPSGRLRRRSAEDLERDVRAVVALLKGKDPMGAEQIREALDVDKRALPKTLAEGLNSGALQKTGEKRSTKYFLGTGEPKRRGTAKKRSAKKE